MDDISDKISQLGLDRLERDKWLSSSLLQKAIRRGNVDWGRAAVNALLDADPPRLWRRLAVIAVEDIGIAGLDLVGQAVAACRSKGRGSQEQRRERALALMEKLCRSPKCRATDDLYAVAAYGRHLERERQQFMALPLDQVVEGAIRAENPEVAAVAAVYALGTMRPGTAGFGARRGSPSMLFDGFLFSGHFLTVTAMCRDGYAATGCELFGLLPLLTRFWNVETFETITDTFPVCGLHEGVPSCAVDYFTRDGRAALTRFLKTNADSARWINERVSPQRRVEALGTLLFHVDGGLMADRLVWPLGLQFREMAERFCNPGSADVREALSLLRADFPAFDRLRVNE